MDRYKKNDIILGYDDDVNDPCLAGYEDIRWNKRILRENLEFRRYLRSGGLTDDSSMFRYYNRCLDEYQQWAESGRGIDDPELAKVIPEYSFIRRFMSQERIRRGCPDIKYEDIKELVIVGHGLEADKEFLSKIIGLCKNMKNVVVYAFDGEKAEEKKKKEAFFGKKGYDIQWKMY